MTNATARSAVLVAPLAAGAALAAALGACHHRGAAKPTRTAAAETIDAGTEEPPDAEPTSVVDASPPPTMTFAPAPWPSGQKIRIWRRVRLADVPGSNPISSEFELALDVTDSSDAATVAIGDDCTAVLGNGSARVTGECGGTAADVGYKLDLAAQLLAVAHGTSTVGDAAPGFARPLVALFHLQDAGAIVTARLAHADANGAVYDVHVELDGLLLRGGLHLTGAADGQLTVDAQARTMSGTLRATGVTVDGYPMAGYSSSGSLELAFGIGPP
jgi:hypothetical protein